MLPCTCPITFESAKLSTTLQFDECCAVVQVSYACSSSEFFYICQLMKYSICIGSQASLFSISSHRAKNLKEAGLQDNFSRTFL